MNSKTEYTAERRAHMRGAHYASKPTGRTMFVRTFLPWQLWRFFRINLKMLTIIHRSHVTHKRT